MNALALFEAGGGSRDGVGGGGVGRRLSSVSGNLRDELFCLLIWTTFIAYLPHASMQELCYAILLTGYIFLLSKTPSQEKIGRDERHPAPLAALGSYTKSPVQWQ